MKGDVVYAPDGEKVVLADIGLVELLDNDQVRVWDVALDPGAVHPWHLHHNPYVVLSLQGSDGRMDWLDGSAPRFISEYRGGAVYRPVSPVHRLTNIGDRFYQNRLIEFKDLGEHLPQPLEIGEGARSIQDQTIGPRLDDGRVPVILHPHVSVWTVSLDPGETRRLDLTGSRHVLALVDAPDVADDPAGGTGFHAGGSLEITNETAESQDRFVVELTYLDDLATILGKTR